MINLQIHPKELLLDRHDTAEMLRVSEDTIRKMEKDGDFPAPFKLGDKFRSKALWKLEDIMQWIDKQNKVESEA